MTTTRFSRPVHAVLLLLVPFLVSACAGQQEVRPATIPLSYQQVASMSPEEFQGALEQGDALAERFREAELAKFRNGDAVLREVGTLQMQAVFDPLLRVGHFTFVNDPIGIEGESTTTTLVVSATADGLLLENQQTGAKSVIVADIGRQPDVARLIISKVGDIFAAGVNGAVGAGIHAATACTKNCGGGSIAISGSTAVSEAVVSGSGGGGCDGWCY